MNIVSWFNGVSSVIGLVKGENVNKTDGNVGTLNVDEYLYDYDSSGKPILKVYNNGYIFMSKGTKVRIISEEEYKGVSMYKVEFVLQKLPFTQNWLKLIVGLSLGAFITVAILSNKDTNKKVKTRNDIEPMIKNPRKTLAEFIKEHREEIDEMTKSDIHNDSERRMWILNDEGLYNWAKSEGVRI